MDNRPIGVFDSGVGGLTAMKELMTLLPHEDIIYFGDTGRVPYGSRSRETIIRYAQQDIDFLLTHDVKLIVAACGTVSSALPASVSDALPVPYMGVIQAAAQAACALSLGGRIGVIGTKATIRNNAYGRAIHAVRPGAQVIGKACPLFVPLVENGHFQGEDPIAKAAMELYLPSFKQEKIDTLILGCTHYPLLYELISAFFDYGVTLVDPGRETAHAVQSYLTVHGLLSGRRQPGSRRYYMTDSAEDFCEVASLFLSCDIRPQAEQVALG